MAPQLTPQPHTPTTSTTTSCSMHHGELICIPNQPSSLDTNADAPYHLTIPDPNSIVNDWKHLFHSSLNSLLELRDAEPEPQPEPEPEVVVVHKNKRNPNPNPNPQAKKSKPKTSGNNGNQTDSAAAAGAVPGVSVGVAALSAWVVLGLVVGNIL